MGLLSATILQPDIPFFIQTLQNKFYSNFKSASYDYLKMLKISQTNTEPVMKVVK